jgi:hypothetical protein
MAPAPVFISERTRARLRDIPTRCLPMPPASHYVDAALSEFERMASHSIPKERSNTYRLG